MAQLQARYDALQKEIRELVEEWEGGSDISRERAKELRALLDTEPIPAPTGAEAILSDIRGLVQRWKDDPTAGDAISLTALESHLDGPVEPCVPVGELEELVEHAVNYLGWHDDVLALIAKYGGG